MIIAISLITGDGGPGVRFHATGSVTHPGGGTIGKLGEKDECRLMSESDEAAFHVTADDTRSANR